jgi:hypothetical protein
MLEPPEWLQRSANATVVAARAEREHARELDLSHWLTRPCIIVMGFLEESAIPIPVEIEGETVPSRGTTLYRWIYPLDGYGWSAPSDSNYRDLVVPERRVEVVPAAPTPPATPDAPDADGTEPVDPNAPAADQPTSRPNAVPAPGRRRGP